MVLIKNDEKEIINKIKEFLRDEDITWQVKELDIDNLGAIVYKGDTNEG